MLRRVLKILAMAALPLAAWLVVALNSRPEIDAYEPLAFPEAPDGPGLRVTFLGVATLLFEDDTAAVMIDGFFTRPGLLRTGLGRIEPDTNRIGAALERIDLTKLDAVIPAHSHYDHAMDAPEVARRTGATVVGSESTANIARGWGLGEDRIHVVHGTETLRYGDLAVTLIPSMHFPHGMAMGEITAPLVPPARATDYKEGGSFVILVESAGKSVLVTASAGYAEGQLAGRHADVVYLGVGLLGEKDEAYQDAYWRETVAAVGARRVVPIHWDDFSRGLDEPLVPLLSILDNLDESMAFIRRRAADGGVDLRWPVLWRSTDPFVGL